MARRAAIVLIAFPALAVVACGGTSQTQTTAAPSTTGGATIATVRVGETSAVSTPNTPAIAEVFTPPPGVTVAPASTPDAITLEVGADVTSTFSYYMDRLSTSGYRVADVKAPDGSGPEILFGNGQEGGAMTVSGTAPNLEVLVHVATFPTTPSLVKTFRMPTGMFRYDYRLVDGVGHHFLYVPNAGPATQDEIRTAASGVGYDVADGPAPSGGTSSLVLTGFGSEARVDLFCAADACRIELYRTT